jgi:hypothetical protein
LPQYLTVEYLEVALLDETRAFAMRGRDTSLLTSLSGVASERFVFYTLPQGDPSYQKYLESARSRLPQEGSEWSMPTESSSSRAPASCLGWLVRKTASAISGEQCVSGVPVEARPVNNRSHLGQR